MLLLLCGFLGEGGHSRELGHPEARKRACRDRLGEELPLIECVALTVFHFLLQGGAGVGEAVLSDPGKLNPTRGDDGSRVSVAPKEWCAPHWRTV
ncbi:MAG: hypothetical protein KAJ42_04765 [Gemmatimonadetes bacterium]|nr:hypothetical protein [Gemmatimonadota bacterium]